MTIDLRGRPFRLFPKDVIGGQILRFGLFDLVVTEALTRLASRGEIVLEVGANIGFMSRVLADAVGHDGHVFSFEPHPAVYEDLVANCSEPNIRLYNVAVSDSPGVGDLFVPSEFSDNRGVSSLDHSAGASSIEVPLVRLDDLFPNDSYVGVMKIDIEGHEMEALRGCSSLLSERRVRDIVFEDHNAHNSEVIQHFQSLDYTIFRLAKRFRGPRLLGLAAPARESSWESPSFLATSDPTRAISLLHSPGWRGLRPRPSS